MNEFLLENDADINAQDETGRTALFDAIGYLSSSNVVKTLLRNGCDLNLRDRYGETVLFMLSSSEMYLSHEKAVRLAQILLKHGATLR